MPYFLKKINKSFGVFLISTVIILWQMLEPGYILTSDMIFTPHLKLDYFFNEGNIINSLPLVYLLKFLNLFLAGWIIQKIIIISLFFLISYLAFKFLPLPAKHYLRWWGALFYTVNPFVYERFLAGHWPLLFAYAFLPPFIYYLLEFKEKPLLKNSLWLFGWLCLINVFSIHIFVMSAIILIIFFVINLLILLINKRQNLQPFLKSFIIGSLGFLILSSYWLVPGIVDRQSLNMNTFDVRHQVAFSTASDQHLGTALNVLALYGYWGENKPWANYFLWPKDNFTFWIIIFICLASLIIFGIWAGFSQEGTRALAGFFLIIGTVAFILSCGVGETIFKNINAWLFSHLSFWAGFRDSSKFSGLLIISYVFFGCLGAAFLIDRLEKKGLKNYFLAILFLIPILYTYTMIGGFARQLRPVWYPTSWQQVNEILNQDKSDFKVLFLPWHMYLSLDFNNNLICSNPASRFFSKPIIQGENMEVEGIFSQTSNSESGGVEKIILAKDKNSEEIINDLQKMGIKYIINYSKITAEDYLKYDFLSNIKLKKIFDNDLTLFEIMH